MICYLARRRFGGLPGPIQRFAYWMADMSFPLYAVHGVLGYTILVHAVEIGVPSWVAVAIALVVVFAVAAVVHRTVELPTHAYGKALALKLTPAQEPDRQDAPDAISRPYMEMTSPAGPNAMIRPSRR
jgi:peptidoglycan/LPS O-acetylase OafA/YrhL